MIIIPHETMVAVDIDDTLVHMLDYTAVGDISVEDPYKILGKMQFKINHPNCNVVKRGYARGYKYFAWSIAGVQHAAAVIQALEMEKYFEFVMTKPTRYIDDKQVQEFITERTWLPPDFPGWQ